MVKVLFTSEDVGRALSDARSFAVEGSYEAALERHVWYHKNALQYAPSHAGVRMSFALAYWMELGAVFPPALDALRGIQRETGEAFRRDPGNEYHYHDAMLISFRLDDLISAKELFYEAQALSAHPRPFYLELDRIIASGDLEWAKDMLGSPEARLEEVHSFLESVRLSQVTGPHIDIAVDSFANEVATYIEGVYKVFGLDRALEVQREALKVLDAPIVRNVLLHHVGHVDRIKADVAMEGIDLAFEGDRDLSYLIALGSISRIELRPFPEGSPLYRFHESFEDDFRRIRLFCRKRRVFGHSSAYICARWDIVNHLEPPYLLFYLPAILLAILTRPRSSLVSMMYDYRLPRLRNRLTAEEFMAVEAVKRYLAIPGVTDERLVAKR